MSKMTFETAMKRLEEIAEHLEDGTRSLDESLKLFDEANRLVGFCTTKLDEAEAKLKILVKNQDKWKLVEGQEE